MKKNMLKEALPALEVLDGPFKQFFQNLRGANGEKWLTEFKKFLRQEPSWNTARKMSKNIILSTEFAYLEPRLKRILIRDLRGTILLKGLDSIFPGGQRSFGHYGLMSVGKKTNPVEVLTYRLRKKTSLSNIFNSFGCRLDDLCFTQEQIAFTVMQNENIINENGEGLFLIKKDQTMEANKENLFAVSVRYVSSDADHALNYVLSVEAKPFDLNVSGDPGCEGTFGRREDILFIPRPLKRKNWLIRASNWLAKHS